MNHNPTKTPTRGTGFTIAQKIVLTLAGLVGLAWITVAAIFVFSNPGQAAPAPTTLVLATQTATEMQPVLATSSPVGAALPAECGAARGSVLEGVFTGVDGAAAVTIQSGEINATIRLAGIQLPGDPAVLEQAAQVMRAELTGLPVRMVLDDPEGAAGFLLVEERMVNLELVQRGLAQWDANADAPCAALFQAAQSQAQAAHVGLWQPTIVPTRTFVPFVTLDPAEIPCACSPQPLCSSFQTQTQAQACYNWCNDYNTRLDDDRDGIACEALP